MLAFDISLLVEDFVCARRALLKISTSTWKKILLPDRSSSRLQAGGTEALTADQRPQKEPTDGPSIHH